MRVTSDDLKRYFYSYCGKDACKTANMKYGRVDPVLKLFPGCTIVLNENKHVCNGQANGSILRLQRVTVKHGEREMLIKLSCGTKVRAFFASQILAITVRHKVEDIIVPREFDIMLNTYSCNHIQRASSFQGSFFGP